MFTSAETHQNLNATFLYGDSILTDTLGIPNPEVTTIFKGKEMGLTSTLIGINNYLKTPRILVKV
jgi:hypothetical protein